MRGTFRRLQMHLRWYYWRLLQRRPCLWLAIVLGTVGLLYFTLFHGAGTCSNSKGQEVLETLCNLYNRGEVSGNMCYELCTSRIIRYKRCLSHKENKIIIHANWYGKNIIMKSKKPFMKNYESVLSRGKPPTEVFHRLTVESINRNLGINLTKTDDLLSRVWSQSFEGHGAFGGRPSAMQSIWSLVQQDEYLIIKFFQNSLSFLKLYGTCGHFYALEHAPPSEILGKSSAEAYAKINWADRVSAALGLLDLVKTMEKGFHEKFHMCNMKNTNFGLSRAKKLKIVDVEAGLFSTNLKHVLRNRALECRRHSDCDYLDCHGLCDTAQKRCTDIRSNNNLQVVCDKFLHTKSDKSKVGLLMDPPYAVAMEVNGILEQCAQPILTSDRSVNEQATWDTFNHLYRVLLSSV